MVNKDWFLIDLRKPTSLSEVIRCFPQTVCLYAWIIASLKCHLISPKCSFFTPLSYRYGLSNIRVDQILPHIHFTAFSGCKWTRNTFHNIINISKDCLGTRIIKSVYNKKFWRPGVFFFSRIQNRIAGSCITNSIFRQTTSHLPQIRIKPWDVVFDLKTITVITTKIMFITDCGRLWI